MSNENPTTKISVKALNRYVEDIKNPIASVLRKLISNYVADKNGYALETGDDDKHARDVADAYYNIVRELSTIRTEDTSSIKEHKNLEYSNSIKITDLSKTASFVQHVNGMDDNDFYMNEDSKKIACEELLKKGNESLDELYDIADSCGWDIGKRPEINIPLPFATLDGGRHSKFGSNKSGAKLTVVAKSNDLEL